MKPSWVCLIALSVILTGCLGQALRSQSPEEFDDAVTVKTRLVGDVARAYGDTAVAIENVALVTGLANTGEDPPMSPERSALLHEMQRRKVKNPNQLLASPTTALVLVHGYLPPGVQKGDKIDLEVSVPARSQTTSLRNGWLMETRLSEMAVMGGEVHEGQCLAIGSGAVLVDPAAEGEKDRGLLVHGHVLGGGVALKSRPIGLTIAGDEKSVRLSAQIGAAINSRFYIYSNGLQKGVASPKTDEFIELAVHPRYKDNTSRYIRVIRSIAVRETSPEQEKRLLSLERQLENHITASSAALQLEAIGKHAVKVLAKGLESDDMEVRFYSAEALAYLDESMAAAPLASIARDEPAFRVYALAALSAMDDVAAYDELSRLLDARSVETRYGAFRSLWAMRANDPLVKGEALAGQFSYHVLNTSGPPMVHVTRTFRPEIVLFGQYQRFHTPVILEAGKSIMISGQEDDKITVSRFAVGEPDQKRQVSNSVDEVIRAIVELGGTYPDVVQALEQASASKSLPGRFEVDAVPDPDRAYERHEGATESAGTRRLESANPTPDLFTRSFNLLKR